MKKSLFFVVFLCVFAFNNSLAQSGKPLFTGIIGIESYTYRNSFPNNLSATLDTIKSLGMLEMQGPNPKNTAAEEFKKLLDERGIKMPSFGADYNAIVQDPQPFIKMAGIFGSSYIMVAWIPHGKTFTIEDAKKAADDFNRVGKILKQHGLTLCYHCHGYEFGTYNDGTMFDYLAKNTDPQYVSFTMDMMWAFHGGADPAQLLYKYKGRWKELHLKDIRKGIANDLTGGTDTKNDVALGTGQINVPEVLKAAKAVGVEHYYIEDESGNHAAQIPQTIAYIKSLRE